MGSLVSTTLDAAGGAAPAAAGGALGRGVPMAVAGGAFAAFGVTDSGLDAGFCAAGSGAGLLSGGGVAGSGSAFCGAGTGSEATPVGGLSLVFFSLASNSSISRMACSIIFLFLRL